MSTLFFLLAVANSSSFSLIPTSSMCRCFFSVPAFRCFGFHWLEEVIDFILPALHVVIFVLRPGFLSAASLAHLSFGSDATLIASQHFILLCVSIQHGILAFFVHFSASAVLLSRIRSIPLVQFLLFFRTVPLTSLDSKKRAISHPQTWSSSLCA